MHYEGHVIRPPSEANSIILQVTVGCSHNKCRFCAAYKGLRFKINPFETILDDIKYASKHYQSQRRLFLCDGDALIIPQKRLIQILKAIAEYLPRVTRVGIYANAKSIQSKSLEELKELKDLGLGILYLGLESGDDETLKLIHKGTTSEKMIQMIHQAKTAGIKTSITVLLGIAGRERSQIHAEATGKVLSAMDPNYVGALSLMLIPGTQMFQEYQEGTFELLEPIEMLQELRTLFDNTHLSQGLFHANHASNYLPIRARLPKDKDAILKVIDAALAGEIPLKPEHLRGL